MTCPPGPMLAAMLLMAAASGVQARPAGENTVYAYAQVLRVTPVYAAAPPESFGHCDGSPSRPDGLERNRLDSARAPRERNHSLGRLPDTFVRAPGTSPCPATAIGMRLDRHLVGYDVEYEYKGDKFMSRMARDPGNRLRVRVSVAPDESGANFR